MQRDLPPSASSHNEDAYRRVARALASVEKESERGHYEAVFLDSLYAGAIGAGRIMSVPGTDIQATLINCFVQPVDDGFVAIVESGRKKLDFQSGDQTARL